MMDVMEIELGGLHIMYQGNNGNLAIELFTDTKQAESFAKLVGGVPCITRIYLDPDIAKQLNLTGKIVQVDDKN